jgi:hypothetical protein
VRNVGAAATNAPITVADSLPNGLDFVSAVGAGWACDASGATVICTTSSSLAAADSSTIILTVSVGGAASPTVTNSATVFYAGDTNAANDTARKPTTVRLRPAHSRAASVSSLHSHHSSPRPAHHPTTASP